MHLSQLVQDKPDVSSKQGDGAKHVCTAVSCYRLVRSVGSGKSKVVQVKCKLLHSIGSIGADSDEVVHGQKAVDAAKPTKKTRVVWTHRPESRELLCGHCSDFIACQARSPALD